MVNSFLICHFLIIIQILSDLKLLKVRCIHKILQLNVN